LRRQSPLHRYYFPDLDREVIRKVHSMGSGVIISKKGYVITNEHVVSNASKIIVNLPDGRSFQAEIVGRPDKQSDIALLKIEGKKLPVAPLGSSRKLMIGEWSIAIGNPFGFMIRDAHPTVTVGVISALNRDFDATKSGGKRYRDMIQTDASINPGNSGGPLVNSQGYVIGINTFIFTRSGGSHGIGFAIPVERIRQALDDILKYGQVRHNFWTGLHVQDMNRWIAESLGIPNISGVIVTDVERGSPAAKAGLRRGDVVTAINGNSIGHTRDIRREFYGLMVRQKVRITYVRGRERSETVIVLEEDPIAEQGHG